jgi:HprK-related kinase A
MRMSITLGELGEVEANRRMRSLHGLNLHMGPFVANVHTPLHGVRKSVAALYADYKVASDQDFVDFHVAVKRPSGLRSLWKPQVVFELDGHEPFNPLPGDQGFPLMEWGLNWCVYGMCHQYLILHAAVLERGGRALILPAPSGSGKSTLCAGLLFSGWRLLSDELAMICPREGLLVPNPRPVSLKNESIAVMQHFEPNLRFGSLVKETSKGVVAHFAAPASAVHLAGQGAIPAWVVLPKYRAGQRAELRAIERSSAFMQLVENAFNYAVFGAQGFSLLGSVVDRSQCFSFEYSSLPEATALFDRLAAGSPVTVA